MPNPLLNSRTASGFTGSTFDAISRIGIVDVSSGYRGGYEMPTTQGTVDATVSEPLAELRREEPAPSPPAPRPPLPPLVVAAGVLVLLKLAGTL